jgi:nucleoside-diphosphate-sugar epimerase/lipopolysaccharide/colanic/teichoic acid biosynthesis glycosyltransferase
MKILVIGASGFIGSAVVAHLAEQPTFSVRAAVRTLTHSLSPAVDVFQVGGLEATTDWSAALKGIDVVVHAAARVHVMREVAANPLSEFRKVNVDGTLNLARQAVAAGVKRFVFISSIKVNGEGTLLNKPYRADDSPTPEDPYGISKLEAEMGLRELAGETGLDVVIVRPPLVYGPNVKGNFQSLIHLVDKGIPLPLGTIHNKRSLLALDNLVDFIVLVINHPAAANQIFLVSDGEDLSTTELLQRLAKALGRPSRLIPFPAKLLDVIAKLLGKQMIAQRLCGNLQVDISKAKDLLGWIPPVTVDEGIKCCVCCAPVKKVNGTNLLMRCFDVIFAASGLILGFPVLLLLTIIGLFDTGSPIFRQQRVGKQQKPFTLVKFRTMKLDTVSVASHLASASSITRFGHLLRRTKLDELPQLWNVLKGEMSLVGPRPCLFNQEELISEREKRGVFDVRPGVTGLAQVNEIDMSTPKLLAETDQKMVKSLSVKDYFRYIFMTVAGKGSGDRVK